MGTYPCSLVGVWLMNLNKVGTHGSLSPHNDPIRASNQVPIVTIDNGSHELYLLPTLEHWGVIVRPLQSCSMICDGCSTILNSTRW